MFNHYDYLSGIVTINYDGPIDWEKKAVLPFWKAPNDSQWGKHLSEVLYHESIHFWQFLSSPYLIQIVNKLWEQLLNFENTGTLSLEDSIWQSPEIESHKHFSNYELVECWARFWDVHTRGPIRIIEDEEIEVEGTSLDYHGNYNNQAYDIVMTKGTNCKLYARPYRWLLEAADGNSLMANILFPLITNAAFSTLNPAMFFSKAMDLALSSTTIRAEIYKCQGQSINLSWLKNWHTVLTEAAAPFIEQSDKSLVPFKKAGYQELIKGPLDSHPIFKQYSIKADDSNFSAWLMYFNDISSLQDPVFSEYSKLINYAASKAPIWAIYGMPGQPFYRLTLGTLVPPPRIEFKNYSWNAPKILEVDIFGDNHRTLNNETFELDYQELIPRIKRFRHALEAVKLGLPPTTFDNL